MLIKLGVNGLVVPLSTAVVTSCLASRSDGIFQQTVVVERIGALGILVPFSAAAVMTCLGAIEVVALSIAALLLTEVIGGETALSRLVLALRRTVTLTAGSVLLVLATIGLILLLLELAGFSYVPRTFKTTVIVMSR